ncbi:MAG TPA: PEGA domain-containing protein [Kofleriaceae bacterium]|nr:PEGA domain-containing protein [Kofleriaceae bacterium]
MTTSATTKVKALCVATRCTNVEQFVATFHRYAEDDAFFVATLTTRPVGLETPFSIQLADKTPVLRGLCVVREAWDHPENPFGRPGIRLGIVRLTSESTEVFERLRARRRATTSSFEDSSAAITQTPTAIPVAIPTPTRPVITQPFPGPAANRSVVPTPQPTPAARIPRRPDSVPDAHDDSETTPHRPSTAPAIPASPTTAPMPAVGKPPGKLEPAAITKLISPLHGGTLSTRPGSSPSIQEIPMPKVERPTPRPGGSKTELGMTPVMRVPDIRPSTPPAAELPPPVRIEPKRNREPAAEPAPVPVTANESSAGHLDDATPFAVPFDDLAIPVEPPSPRPSPAGEPGEPTVHVAAEATETDIAIGRVSTASALDPAAEAALRTPGSDLVLPANPLMNLTDKSLEGFVDCTLYEETGSFPIDEGEGEVDPLIGPPESGRTRTTSVSPPLVLPTPSQVLSGNDSEPTPIAEAPRRATTPPPIAMPRTRTSEPAILRAQTPAPARDEDLEPEIAVAPARDSVQPAIAPVAAVSPPVTPAAPKRTRWMLGVLVTALLAAGGALFYTRVWVHDDTQRATTAAAPPAPAVAPTPPPTQVAQLTVDAGAEDDETEPEPPPPPTGGPPVVGKGPCRINVVATPAGANVAVDGQFVGPAPLAIDGPCEARKVDLSHPRYAFVTRTVTPQQGKPETVDVTMVRPTHAVMVVTKPAGATVLIDGRRAGTSPTVVNVMGFQSMSLSVQKPGYRPVTQRLYSRNASDRVVIEMTSELFPPKKSK